MLGGGKYDFRGINWGMSKDEVMAREKSRPFLEEEKQGSKIVHFASSLYGLRANLAYTFTGNKCWYAVYKIKSGGQADMEDMKAVYRKIEHDLLGLYGGPFANLDMEYESIYARAWKTQDADIFISLGPAAESDSRLELSLSFLCRDLMHEVLNIGVNSVSGFVIRKPRR